MNRNILKFSLCCMIIFSLISCKNSDIAEKCSFQRDKNAGNTIGNLWRHGLIAQDDENLYYMAFENNSPRLVKSDFEGNHKEIISESFCTYINVLGEWIYYINSDDNKIYKMDKLGKQKQKLSEIEMKFLVAYKDILYGICISNEDNNHIYSMNINGGNISNLSNEVVSGFFLLGDLIYYTVYNDKTNKCYIYSLNLNSMEKKVVFYSENDISWFYVYNNSIYFLTGMGNLKCVNILDNNKDVKIYDNIFVMQGINAIDNLIFYCDFKSNEVNVLDLNNDKKIKLTNEQLKCIHLFNNKLFYHIGDKLFSINIDGSNKKSWGI